MYKIIYSLEAFSGDSDTPHYLKKISICSSIDIFAPKTIVSQRIERTYFVLTKKGDPRCSCPMELVAPRHGQITAATVRISITVHDDLEIQ